MKVSKMSVEQKKWFCEKWPELKKGIEVVKTVSANIVVRIACNIIIAAGDAASEIICAE